MARKATSKAGEGATAGRLLDAAEWLFGAHGLDGVGMRALAEAAGVNLGAASYHFGSKEALYLETFMRRFRPTNAERMRLLREAELLAKDKPVSVEKIVECLIRPPFESGCRHPRFRQFMARNLFMPPPFLQAAMEKELGPSKLAFRAALLRTVPHLSPHVLQLRMRFSMGALLGFSMQTPNIPDQESDEIREERLRELVRFITAGWQSEPAVYTKGRGRSGVPKRVRQ